MTFSLIDELRKELVKTDQLIEFDISKRDQLIEAIRILEANEKPKRRIYTIRNNESLVKLIIPARYYDSYRNFYPNDAIEVCVDNDVILYAADSELEYDWRLSLTKAQNPQLFADVLDMLEREEFLQSTSTMVNPRYVLQAPCWNYNGADVAATKDET